MITKCLYLSIPKLSIKTSNNNKPNKQYEKLKEPQYSFIIHKN